MTRQRFIVSLAALGIVVGACDPDLPDEAAPPTLASYDGEDLFRGVVLGYGPVAELVPEIQDHFALSSVVADSGQRAEIEATFDQLVDEMAELDPEFFADFADDLRSGDARVVDEALADASSLAERAAERVPEFAQAEAGAAAPANTAAELFVTTTTVAFVFVYVHSAIHVVRDPFVVVFTAVPATSDQGPLLHDRLVQRIATDAYVNPQ